MKNSIVGLKELRKNMENYISRAGKGESFLIIRRSKPVFRISPPEDEGVWEEVVDFTKIKKGGISIADIIVRL